MDDVLLLVLFCAHAGKEELSCRRVTFSHVQTPGILSYFIDFDEQIPLESPLSTSDRQFQVHHISQALVSLPWACVVQDYAGCMLL